MYSLNILEKYQAEVTAYGTAYFSKAQIKFYQKNLKYGWLMYKAKHCIGAVLSVFDGKG